MYDLKCTRNTVEQNLTEMKNCWASTIHHFPKSNFQFVLPVWVICLLCSNTTSTIGRLTIVKTNRISLWSNVLFLVGFIAWHNIWQSCAQHNLGVNSALATHSVVLTKHWIGDLYWYGSLKLNLIMVNEMSTYRIRQCTNWNRKRQLVCFWICIPSFD